MISVRFIAAVILKQAKRQTVGSPMLNYTRTTFPVIRAIRFWATTFFYIFTLKHFFCSYQILIITYSGKINKLSKGVKSTPCVKKAVFTGQAEADVDGSAVRASVYAARRPPL